MAKLMRLPMSRGFDDAYASLKIKWFRSKSEFLLVLNHFWCIS